MTRLTVVVPSWNTRELLRACLASVRATAEPGTEVVVVDNASADGSADMVEREFGEVVLVRNARNEGFARACNQGIERATGEHVLLLNSDTEVRGGALSRMCEFLESHPGHGACAPRLVNPDGSTQRACMRFPSLATPLFFGTPLERWMPESRELRRYFCRDWDHADEREVEQPPAACLCLARRALEAVGGFDEDLWLFYNDVDLSRRLAAAGLATRYLPDVEVLHHEGASTRQFAGFLPIWQADRLRYYRKHHGRAAGWWLKACVALSLADHAAVQLGRRIRGRAAEPVGPLVRAYLRFLRQ